MFSVCLQVSSPPVLLPQPFRLRHSPFDLLCLSLLKFPVILVLCSDVLLYTAAHPRLLPSPIYQCQKLNSGLINSGDNKHIPHETQMPLRSPTGRGAALETVECSKMPTFAVLNPIPPGQQCREEIQ